MTAASILSLGNERYKGAHQLVCKGSRLSSTTPGARRLSSPNSPVRACLQTSASATAAQKGSFIDQPSSKQAGKQSTGGRQRSAQSIPMDPCRKPTPGATVVPSSSRTSGAPTESSEQAGQEGSARAGARRRSQVCEGAWERPRGQGLVGSYVDLHMCFYCLRLARFFPLSFGHLFCHLFTPA